MRNLLLSLIFFSLSSVAAKVSPSEKLACYEKYHDTIKKLDTKIILTQSAAIKTQKQYYDAIVTLLINRRRKGMAITRNSNANQLKATIDSSVQKTEDWVHQVQTKSEKLRVKLEKCLEAESKR